MNNQYIRSLIKYLQREYSNMFLMRILRRHKEFKEKTLSIIGKQKTDGMYVIFKISHTHRESRKKRASGGCLGNKRRRRTWYSAISPGEVRTTFDPGISEWGNPISSDIIFI